MIDEGKREPLGEVGLLNFSVSYITFGLAHHRLKTLRCMGAPDRPRPQRQKRAFHRSRGNPWVLEPSNQLTGPVRRSCIGPVRIAFGSGQNDPPQLLPKMIHNHRLIREEESDIRQVLIIMGPGRDRFQNPGQKSR